MPSYIPIEVIPIEGDGYHLMIEVTANGRPVRMLIDTGASRSVFDKDRVLMFLGDEMPELRSVSPGRSACLSMEAATSAKSDGSSTTQPVCRDVTAWQMVSSPPFRNATRS